MSQTRTPRRLHESGVARAGLLQSARERVEQRVLQRRRRPTDTRRAKRPKRRRRVLGKADMEQRAEAIGESGALGEPPGEFGAATRIMQGGVASRERPRLL